MERVRFKLAVRFAPLLVLLVAVTAVLIAPIGYMGGGADDVHYLDASRCWVAAGHPCLPHTHWASRWPAIAPMAIFTGLFGESRLTVEVGPLLAWAACIALTWAIGRAWFDRATGVVAAALLAASPVVTQLALQPGVDTTELALQLGALLLATRAYQRQSATFAVAAGICAAVATEARETSFLFCGAAGLAWLLLERDRRRVLLWALAGFAGAIAVELAAFAAITGDPMFRYHLSLGHVRIPSSELSPSVDTSRSPIFNPQYIAGWRREAGISLWWPLDPWLNLIASPRIGLLLAGLLLIVPIGWRPLPANWKRVAGPAIGLALLLSASAIYGLAVDPKSRMFLTLAAACSLAIAAMTVASWHSGRGAVPGVLVGIIILGGLDALSLMVNTHEFEQQARRWIRTYPGEVAIDPDTRSTLTLVPEARALPLAGSGEPLVIRGTNDGCEALHAPIVASVGEKGSGALCLVAAKPLVASPRFSTGSRAAARSNPT
jgi:4-amino-4-deoxy-L-arabinose transferase-like glycosyltransferase